MKSGRCADRDCNYVFLFEGGALQLVSVVEACEIQLKLRKRRGNKGIKDL